MAIPAFFGFAPVYAGAMLSLRSLGWMGLLLGVAACAQAPAAMQMVVTAIPQKGDTAAILPAQVDLQQGHSHDAVTNWQAIRGDKAIIELVIALDEDTQHMGGGFNDLKDFINRLPPNVAVALVYLHTAVITITQGFTLNHALVLKQLRMPSGLADSSPSPYGSLQTLLRVWREHPEHAREMVMISDGEEHVGGNTSDNTTYKTALAELVQGGIVSYTVYIPGTPDTPEASVPRGRFSSLDSSNFSSEQGESNLVEVASDTGGAAYSPGSGGGNRLTGFLDDVLLRLQSQYRLTFTPSLEGNRGMVGVKVELKDSRAHVTAPQKIYLPKN